MSKMIGEQTPLADFRELLTTLASGWRPWIGPAFRRDIAGREIVCTPYGGNYGRAGWVIVVNGSPPRCTIIYEHGAEKPVAIVSDRSRRLGTEQAKIVQLFVATTLADRTEAVVIPCHQ